MWSWIKTILVVTVVSAIVWIFAEAETLRSIESAVEVTFQAEPASNLVIGIVDPAPTAPGSDRAITLRVTIEGPSASLDAAQRVLQRPMKITPGTGPLPTRAGEWAVSTRDLLRAVPQIRELGVTIKAVQPDTLHIAIDELASREVTVSVQTPDDRTDGAPEVSPRTVVLRYPKSAADRVSNATTASVRVDDATWQRLVPGKRESIPGLRVELPEALRGLRGVRAEPATVDVAVTVRSRTANIVIPRVPVQLRIPPTELSKFDIQIPEQDRSIIDVSVSGPSELIRQIDEKALVLVAMVPLSFEELERAADKGPITKEAVFTVLPTPLKIEAANRTVHLTIKRRAPEPAPGSIATPPKQ